MNTLLIAPEPAASPTARAETSPMPNFAPARRLAAAEPRARILYVDDEPLLRRLGELALVRMGYDVDTAVDGTHGWEELQHTHYNLLITDDTMPGLTGLELSRNARLAGMRLPIMMTSDSISAMQNPAWAQLDIAAFLPKPFAFDALVHTVEQVLISANNDRASDAVMESALMHLVRAIRPYRHGGINE
jgi:DNA-binding response OmpR family regulator